MSLTTLDQWIDWAARYECLPYIRKCSGARGVPASWEPFWQKAAKPSFVLESGKSGRYTYLGDTPLAAITGKGEQARIVRYDPDTAAVIEERQVTGKPLPLVKAFMDGRRAPKVGGVPPFVGGCVGYWSYDVARSIERLPVLAVDDLQLPDYDFMIVRRIWAYDLQERELYCIVHQPAPGAASVQELERLYREAEAETARMAQRWDEAYEEAEADERTVSRLRAHETISRQEALAIDVENIPGIELAFTKRDYVEAVRKIQQYIAQGDVFQVNLSVRQSRRLEQEPEQIYEWLRLLNPSPYMGLLRFPGYDIVSGSPELLVKCVDGVVETRPIAGTRPRGSSDEEDRRLAEELIGNEKERAEHVMLVDLLRNDLGRVSRYGTVKVTDLMVVETYSHVMHIVSHVEGRLADHKDVYDVTAATFPGGTITGAPKIRTMEIIEELEPVRRGPYTGSIGWIDYCGDMELNIVIRTLVATGGIGYVQSGAGIVIDSVPEKEFTESLNKAKALWKAVLHSENRGS
ncbi:anthranilate synthase component I family protein [Paenibacillus ginsengarvi]|uniref:Anthranilate synthase component I family protein n=1 Tax=Paenibacillus ginsengarvi TaxID=400777 RepID=A0A3B0AZ52_9BACL|nr:anthranilate synthase component I family protein [Paenibacillus ginsengarvi]RKN65773.1 anthranilate synthase component I family protein [Paenibacillus ginsengarvi]